MKKSELVAKLAKELATTQEQAGNVLDVVGGVIISAIKANQEVPFGSFKIKPTTSKARSMKLPGGQMKDVPALRSMRISVGARTKEFLNAA